MGRVMSVSQVPDPTHSRNLLLPFLLSFLLFLTKAIPVLLRAFAGHWRASDNSVWLEEGQGISSQSFLN